MRRNSRDSIERTHRRSYSSDTGDKKPSYKKIKNKGPIAGFWYMVLTFIMLAVLYPIGLIFLWAKRLRWQVASKLIITIVMAVVFGFLSVLALNFETDSLLVSGIQSDIKEGLSYVADASIKSYDDTQRFFTGRVKLLDDEIDNIFKAAKISYAKGIIYLDSNTKFVEKNIDVVFLNARDVLAKTVIKLKTGEAPVIAPKAVNTIAPEAAPAPVTEQSEYVDDDISAASVTSAPTQKVLRTLSPVNTPVPTEEPTPTPKPTMAPTPVPTPLPTFKPVSELKTYYFDTSKFYHAVSDCQNMHGAPEHSLLEAKESGKKRCEVCSAPDHSLLDLENVVWIDSENIVHLSDGCQYFSEGAVTLKTLSEAEELNFCTECKASEWLFIDK